MRVTIATDRAPGQLENEDFAGSVAHAAVLLDGAGLSGVDDGGCAHGVAWYTRKLGTCLLANLHNDADSELTHALSSAIAEVAASHQATCDLAHPGTPSATVVILRERSEHLDYLVLADSTLVLAGLHGDFTVVTDQREAEIGRRYRAEMDALIGGTAAHAKARAEYVAKLRAHRNREGGFFVAAADPDVAKHSLTATAKRSEARHALLLSDGASRLNDRFRQQSWAQTLQLVTSDGPGSLIAAVREAEHEDPEGHRWPRGKIHDDATAILCELS
ncbi:MAG TPA: hypothetical protein VL551_34305 [Actinospica sp.]|jgi:hypothetical protein|nr:hypothetical protein [Actinospica sp.]